MKITNMTIAAAVLAVLSTPTVLADDATGTGTANTYFDANWALFTNDSQPLPPAARKSAEISARYFDANWALINNSDQTGKQPSDNIVIADTH